ncbi:F510_1955 family glycosylhydrolase [Yinghuangia sp. YIM S10712]|uniref:F510_1955 family glycosylhydrolase n=1 Tax=Yinghuangia sp. YIM S10712 TaxID=3436930 RepID=UPI003F53AAA5
MTRATQAPRNRRRLIPAALAAIVLANAAACSGTDAPPDSTGEAATAAPQFGHVHGLGIDPADGTVYAATHHGVFALTGDGAVPVGQNRGDFMGFTVTGPGTFLASGHPAPGSSRDHHFGLLESTDSGSTWTALSLTGQADFHALEHAHGTVYGYDSTSERIRVSADRLSWDDRAGLEATDLAIHPSDADVLFAATADGVRRSTDAGRTFAAATCPRWQPARTYCSPAP